MSNINIHVNKVYHFVNSKLFYKLIISWFFIQAIFLTFTIKVGLPPDESWHLGLIKLYARDGIDPLIQNQNGYYFLGDVIRNTGFFYHYILSFPYRIFDFLGLESFSFYLFRLLSVFLGFGIILIISKISDELRLSKAVKNVSLFLFVNTAMFVFISAAVSYDILTILFSALAVLYLLKILNYNRINNYFILLLVLLLGSITKVSFLPLAAIISFIAIIKIVKNQKELYSKLKYSAANLKRTHIFFVSVLAILLIFVSWRYASNYLDYGKLIPRCDQLHSVDKCNEYLVYKRNIELVKNKPNTPLLSFVGFSARWFILMQERTYAVFSNKSYKLPKIFLLGIILTYSLWTIAFIRKVNLKDYKLIICLSIALIYSLIVLQTNFGSYLRYGIFGVAIQGRYLLPVLYIFFLVGLKYALSLSSNQIYKVAIITPICLLYLLSCAPVFLLSIDHSWFNLIQQGIV